MKEDSSRSERSASFIDVESGGGPVHAPCLKQRAAKLRGKDRSTEIILAQKTIFKKIIYTS
jgi:hypothetical protein